MCRSIKKLVGPDVNIVDVDIQTAALQFVRKVSGIRKPSKANQIAYDQCCHEVEDAVTKLLVELANTNRV